MTDITIIFKNGKEVTFPVEDFTVKTVKGEMTGYDFKGGQVKKGFPMFVNIKEVVAIMQKGV